MKNVLSCVVSALMLVSGLGINTFAVVPDTYEGVIPGIAPTYYVSQDYTDETVIPFTAVMGTYGDGSKVSDPIDETNTVFSLRSTETATASLLHSSAAVTSAKLNSDCKKVTVEFKVYPKNITETIHVSLRIPYLLNLMSSTFSANCYTADDGTKIPKGMDWIIYHQNFKANEWNTVKVEVNIPDNYAFGPVASYPEASGGKAATVTVNDVALNGKNSGIKTPTAGDYGVMTEGFGTRTTGLLDLMAIIGYTKTSGLCNSAEGDRDILFDDLKIYIPGTPDTFGTIDYPVKRGTVVHTIEDELTFSAATAGFNNSATVTGDMLSLDNPVVNTNTNFYISFDAKANEIGAYPITLQLASGKTGGINIAANKEGWQTYKIHMHGAGEGQTMTQIGYIACKPTGSNEAFTPLSFGTDYTKTRDGLGANNYCMRFSWVANLSSKLGWNADKIATTEWQIKNFQVVEAATDGAYRAIATDNGDGTADVEAYFSTIKESVMPFVAVYDSDNRMVDSKCAEATYEFDGAFEATVNYEAGNTAKLFFWEDAKGTPFLGAFDLPVK